MDHFLIVFTLITLFFIWMVFMSGGSFEVTLKQRPRK